MGTSPDPVFAVADSLVTAVSLYPSVSVSLYLCISVSCTRLGVTRRKQRKRNAPEGGKPSAFPFELWVPAALSPPSGGRKSKERITQNPLRTSALGSQISLCASKKAASARLFFPPASHVPRCVSRVQACHR